MAGLRIEEMLEMSISRTALDDLLIQLWRAVMDGCELGIGVWYEVLSKEMEVKADIVLLNTG
jgi:hypothetical protein